MKKFIKRFVFTFIFEWEQVIPHFNWYTFTPIRLEFEYDKWLQGLEITFILVGVGFTLRFNLPSSDKILKEYLREVE